LEEGSSSTKSKLEVQPAEMADLFSKCAQLAAQEEKEMGKIMSTMLPVLEYLGEPVVLKPESLGDRFRSFKYVILQSGAVVMTTDVDGNISSKPLAEFSTEDCLAILRDSFPELLRLASEKRQAAMVGPGLSLRIAPGGAHQTEGVRSHYLVVSNMGGPLSDLVVSSLLPGGRTKIYRPGGVHRGGKLNIDLEVLQEESTVERVELQIDCTDAMGHQFRGREFVRLDGADVQVVGLRKKS
jgi:hypothetical protein